jgi:hypothetical protein
MSALAPARPQFTLKWLLAGVTMACVLAAVAAYNAFAAAALAASVAGIGMMLLGAARASRNRAALEQTSQSLPKSVLAAGQFAVLLAPWLALLGQELAEGASFDRTVSLILFAVVLRGIVFLYVALFLLILCVLPRVHKVSQWMVVLVYVALSWFVAFAGSAGTGCCGSALG